jgi:DNA-binding IclR family transcriptional regulator
MDKTLIKGVQLLDALVRAGRPMGVTEIARETKLAPSNVHRTLQTWSHLGFVAQDETSGAYHCTLRLFEWGCRVADTYDVRRVAREHLARLALDTQETIHLAVLDGAEIVYLEKIDSPQPVRAYSEMGGRAPAHCVATGKALLAYGGPAALVALPDPLPRPTIKTVAGLEALRTQLDQVRQRGYAVNREEWRTGVNGLGAPIFDQHGRAVAAIGLSAPTPRLGAARERELGLRLVATATAVTLALTGTKTGNRRSATSTA